MTRILLTGGTGFIGRHLRSALQRHRTVLLGRKEPTLQENEQWSFLDLSDPFEPEVLAEGEILCHLAYSGGAGSANVEHNLNLLRAVNACPSVQRVVLLSTTSVYGRGAASGVVDEESPCYPVGQYPETKLKCEALWREGLREDCSLVVLRPSEVVGPGGKGLLPLIGDALRRPWIGALKRGLLHHRRLHYVAVRNVVAAILFCMERPPATRREVYVVSDDHRPENQSYAKMQDAVRNVLGKRPLPSLMVPRPMLRALGKITGRPLGSSRVYSSRKIREAGFVDAVPLVDEVRRVVQVLT